MNKRPSHLYRKNFLQKLKDNPYAACHEKLPVADIHKKHEPIGCTDCHAPHTWKP